MPDAGRTGIAERPNEIEALVAQLGGDATATAATLSAALMTVVLLQFFTGSLADRYGRRLVLGSAALAGGFTSLGCALAASWSQLLVMRILGGVADAVAMPALLGLTVEMSRGRQGTFLGPYARRRSCPSFWGLRSAAPTRVKLRSCLPWKPAAFHLPPGSPARLPTALAGAPLSSWPNRALWSPGGYKLAMWPISGRAAVRGLVLQGQGDGFGARVDRLARASQMAVARFAAETFSGR